MPESHVDFEVLKRGGVVKLKEKDMFSMWVKTACCNLSSTQLCKLADVINAHARGFLLFTTRQIPIIPFVHIGDVAEVKSKLAEVDLELDRCGPRVRNTNVCYDRQVCPAAVVDCISLGEKLESFFASPILHKVKIGVAGCKRDCIISRILTDLSFIGEEKGYAFYLGGRLGVNPFVGIKIAEGLSEEQCVGFVQSYLGLLDREGGVGERGADLIGRLGVERVKTMLSQGMSRSASYEPIPCTIRPPQKVAGKTLLRIRAICGEVTSLQLRKIAVIADRFGLGLVHCAVRCPEIPGIQTADLPEVGRELGDVGLQILDRGIDNLQSCFGNYCTEGLADPQTLLRQIEKKVEEIGLNNLDIKVSATGCPNSCGIAHVNDIGFHGVVEPMIDADTCNACGLCAEVCKRKAIAVGAVATIDAAQCRHCGQCIVACPTGAILEKRKGFAVLVGGREGEQPRLGERIAGFVSAEEALGYAEACLRLLKERNTSAADIIDEVGLERFKEMIAPSQLVRGTGRF